MGRLSKYNAVNVVTREFFQASVLTYLILVLVESIQPGIVSYFFNMNYLLGFVFMTGVLMVLTDPSGQVGNISKKSSQAAINLAAKGAYQAKQVQLAAQQQAAVAKREAMYRTQQVKHVTAVQAHRVAPQAFNRPISRPQRPIRSIDGIIVTRPSVHLDLRQNKQPARRPKGLIQ